MKNSQTWTVVTVLALVSALGLPAGPVQGERSTSHARVLLAHELTRHDEWVIRELIYKNANHLSDQELEQLTGLRQGGPFNPLRTRRARLEIEDYLKRSGRYFASVRLEEGGNREDRRVVFNVTEGPIVRVRRVRFIGNREFGANRDLRKQIDTREAFLGLDVGGTPYSFDLAVAGQAYRVALILESGGFFNPLSVDHDVGGLTSYYQGKGYWDARVTRELVFSDDFTNVDVFFHIHEGERYRIKSVLVDESKLQQLSKGRSARAARALGVRPGDYYDEETVAVDKRKLGDFHGTHGLTVAISREVYFPPPQTGVVNLVYEIKEETDD